VGEPRLLARSLEGLAGALSVGDRGSEAAGLLGVADATRASARAELPEAESDDMRRISSRLRDRLGNERFEAEFARGYFEPPRQVEPAPAAGV
jgi:hypothetical protein